MGLADLAMHPDLMTELTQFEDAGYPLTCAIYPPVKTKNAAGQEVRTFTAVLSGHSAIKCRKTPLIEERPASTEWRQTSGFEREVGDYQISCAGYYPAITAKMQVQCDGVRYEISGVEHDANHLHTRLRAFLLEPFNA